MVIDRITAARVGTRGSALPLDVMLPAPAQGAISLQCRENFAWTILLERVDDRAAHAAVSAERAFLRGLGGGCALPIAAYGQITDATLYLRGRVLTADGRRQVDVEAAFSLGTDWVGSAHAAGESLARQALDVGARGLIEENF